MTGAADEACAVLVQLRGALIRKAQKGAPITFTPGEAGRYIQVIDRCLEAWEREHPKAA